MAYQVILEPDIGQFREFESPRPPSAYSYNFVGTFSCAQIDLRKARERELATLDEKSTSSGLTLCAIKIEGKNRGEEGTAPVTTAYPEGGKQMCVKEEKKKNRTPQVRQEAQNKKTIAPML